MKTTYTITGSSRVKPVDLPEGFEVHKNETKFRTEVSGVLLEDSNVYDHRLYIKSPSSHLTATQVEALRAALTEWLTDHAGKRRIVHDGSDSVNTQWRWYEVAPDRFSYELTEQEALKIRAGVESGEEITHLRSFESIKTRFGIRTVTAWDA